MKNNVNLISQTTKSIMIKKLLLLYIILIFCSADYILSKDLYPKNPNIDILNYSFELHHNDTNDII